MREREGDLAVLSGVLKVKFTIVIVFWGKMGRREEGRKEGEKNMVDIAMVRVS
jgi:hypothetical protein